MQTQPVQITGYKQRKKDPAKPGRDWTLHIYTASDDRDYSTLDLNVSNQAYAAWQAFVNNQPSSTVVLEYNEEQKGQYVNYRLTAVQPAAHPVQQAPDIPSPVVPHVFAETGLGAGASQHTAIGTDSFQDKKELRIMRQSGLGYAIAAVQAGIWQPSKGMHSVLKYAEYLATDFFLNGPAKVDGDDIPF